tara:strand:+ start:5659 stop:6219 length:561 start_codon:yes stop_codon:yes gene_type:complete
MKTFDDFKLEKEKHEIATLICDLNIDPDAYFEQVLNEGIFKKMGDWWKKNVSAPNVVRLKSSYEQAQQAVDNFIKNFYALRKQGHMPQSASGLNMAISKVKQNLDMMKDQVAHVDKHAQQGVTGTPYGDIGQWDGGEGPSMGQRVQGKVGDMKKSFDDWRAARRQRRMDPWQAGMANMAQQNAAQP